MRLEKTTYLIVAVLVGALMYSCATIGRPGGGPLDKDPPIFVGSSPRQNALKFSGNRVVLNFDEIVVLKDQSEKVVISPLQKEMPTIRAQGRSVTIEFKDTLLPNTTYSIDFANSIQDNNENNPLEDFAFAFSTGDSIDSLQVSGIVLRARDLEPMQGVIVGIHSNLDDSAFTKLQFDRIARTNDRGQFTIRNLKAGKYRIYALNDMDRDYKFVRTEDMAFLLDTIIPGAYQEATMDTLFTKTYAVDTVVPGMHTVFTPNDILLSMSNEGYASQYLHTYERVEFNRIYVKFATKSDTLPTLRLLNPAREGDDWYRLEHSEFNDSLVYWITDTSLIGRDSIQAELHYLRTDTTDRLSYATDTLFFNVKSMFKRQYEKAQEEKAKQTEELREEYERNLEEFRKRAEDRKNEKDTIKAEMEARSDSMELARIVRAWRKDSISKVPVFDFKLLSTASVDVDAPLQFTVVEPIDSISMAGFHLSYKEDTIWTDVPVPELVQDKPFDIKTWNMPVKWEPGGTYKIRVDSMSVYGIYGLPNNTLEQEFSVKALEEYSNLFLNVMPADSSAMFVELLSSSDAVMRTAPVVDGYAEFLNVTPGDYYARVVIDANGNGEWDPGNYALHIQPEEVYYYPKKLTLKKNWDIEQSWNIYELPVDLQKPVEIKKNRPEKKKWEETEKKEGTDEEEDDFAEPLPIYTGNKYTDYRQNM